MPLRGWMPSQREGELSRRASVLRHNRRPVTLGVAALYRAGRPAPFSP